MNKETDIVIIGGGLASLAAVVELEKTNKKITLVNKAPGAMALSCGGWDLADHPRRAPTDPWEKHSSISDNFLEIIRQNEFHPYGIFSQRFSESDYFGFLQEKTKKVARVLPLEMAGDLKENKWMLTDLGTVRPAALVQGSMSEADVKSWRGAKVLVVGLEGFAGFNPNFIQKSLHELQRGHAKDFISEVETGEVRCGGVVGSASLTAFELARTLDRGESARSLAEGIAILSKEKKFTHLILPPVLGLQNSRELMSLLEKTTGLKVAESLATPMSIPGLRIWEASRRYFRGRGIANVEGEAVDFQEEGRRILSLDIRRGGENLRLSGKQFILATGKYLGGGISRQDRFHEPLFHLPIFCEGKILADQSLVRLARPHPWEAQPFFQAGVKVDENGQPLGEDGEILYENLFAAGSILTGFDPAHERCHAGVSILSGSIAAQSTLKES